MGTDRLDQLDLLATFQAAFADAVDRARPGAPVPGIGEWRVRELVAHLAGVHHWAAGMATGDPARPDHLPVGDGRLGAHYRAHAAALHATLAGLAPGAPCPTLTGPGTASFWRRRQVHETLVHLHDLHAALAGARTPGVLDGVVPAGPAVWADGVDEVVTMFEPRQVRLGRAAPLPRTVALHATDAGERWVLGAHEDGRDRTERPAATLAAPARDLALVLWRRLPLDTVDATVTGDPVAVADALARPVTP
ncbi:maleylpyruvate isomerase N-terminal domain-containing protein [Puerhibacterium puerhi]|uniref:maleylpyruvate isomerase N-terminal domain-containing protein n=1 Tax=Puerhibacterium puerhi TaxID=2692623 RepID=UPI0013582E9F|nr:maleylpyruvate isomerase N-terminal domain-containing protein [Puerhibacterium puerhi]